MPRWPRNPFCTGTFPIHSHSSSSRNSQKFYCWTFQRCEPTGSSCLKSDCDSQRYQASSKNQRRSLPLEDYPLKMLSSMKDTIKEQKVGPLIISLTKLMTK